MVSYTPIWIGVIDMRGLRHCLSSDDGRYQSLSSGISRRHDSHALFWCVFKKNTIFKNLKRRESAAETLKSIRNEKAYEVRSSFNANDGNDCRCWM